MPPISLNTLSASYTSRTTLASDHLDKSGVYRCLFSLFLHQDSDLSTPLSIHSSISHLSPELFGLLVAIDLVKLQKRFCYCCPPEWVDDEEAYGEDSNRERGAWKHELT